MSESDRLLGAVRLAESRSARCSIRDGDLVIEPRPSIASVHRTEISGRAESDSS